MPGAVGADAFWKQMTAWIGEDQSDQETLDNDRGRLARVLTL